MNLIKKYKDDLLYFELNTFNQIDYVDHLFTSRIGWEKENIKKNISNIFDVCIDSIIGVKQVHGTDIMVIDENIHDFKELIHFQRDGILTHRKDVVLTTYHADCVPIYFLDKSKNIIGMAHGGWKGTYNNITGKMIDKMKEVYNSDPKDILIGIGPSIGSCCYEVGEELGEKFLNRYGDFKNIVEESQDKIYLNLWKVNYLQAIKSGVLKENIVSSKTCTSCRVDNFYSYRKENGIEDRMVAAIRLR